MTFALVRLAGPAGEPVTLAGAKAHLRVVDTAEDAYIEGLIAMARQAVEDVTGRALLPQSWRLRLDAWPRRPSVDLPRAPLRAVSAVRLYDGAGATTLWDGEDYFADTASAPGRLVRRNGAWPLPGRHAAGIEIDFEAGYDEETLPAPLRRAVLLYVAHFFEHRESVFAGGSIMALPMSVAALVAPYQMVRL